MSDIVYTPGQEKAIKERDKNIIISAAAGSGKTRVLVDRVISLMLDEKVPIDKMIIVTFTNKASIEMKDRIREALENQIENNISNKFLKDQLRLLKHAHIQTLHSFASDMLREYFYYFDDLSPNFSIISENSNVILKEEAIDEVFDEEYAKKSADFHNFIHNFATSRNDRAAKSIILKTYDKLTSQIDPIAWLDSKTASPFDFNIFKEIVREKIDLILEDISKNKSIAGENNLRVEYEDMLSDDYNLVNILNQLIFTDWDLFIEKINKAKFSTMVRARKDEKDIQAIIKNNRDLYKKELKNISSLVLNTNSHIISEFGKKEVEVLKEINYLTKRFIKKYKAKKKDKSYLDFNDIEAEFIKLIDNEEANQVLRERFVYIFFDEYQDSNEIQNYIIEKLKRSNNLFFVGDVKQSIYGFRRAEPQLFLDKLESYNSDENKDSIRINLNENFRTDRDIIDFVNYIFDRLMTKEASGIDYKNGGHRLNPTKEFDKKNPKSEVRVLEDKLSEENHLVKLIENLIEEGYEYKDIAILLRSGAKSYLYENAFKKAGIPFFNDISKVSFGAVEVTFFINMLKLIANPKDDITLLSVIRSDIYKFSEDDIAAIRLNSKYNKFYEAFENYDKDDNILVKINDFKTAFNDFSYQLSLMDLYEFGNYIFENSKFYEFLMARDRASDRIANVEAFIDLMSDFEANNDNGLYGFLDYVENLSLYQTDNMNPARELSENENLVRIMTIHKSKGLEFPVVILADANKRFNNKHLRESVVFDDDLGIGINVADYENKIRLTSLKKDLITEKMTLENKREEMRILYVALTRAINKLIVVGNRNLNTVNKLNGRDDYLNMSTYLDWIIASLSNDIISRDLLENEYITDDLSNIAEILTFTEESNYEVSKGEDISDILAANVKDKLYYKFVDLFTKRYEYEADTKDSIKKSVTEISKNFNPEEDGYELPSYSKFEETGEFRKPNFISEVKEYKPTDRGTIIHKIFQGLSYQRYDNRSLDRALKRLVLENKIKQDELKVIEEEKIIEYFKNPIIKNLYQSAANIRKEETFLMKYEDYYVNGQIDIMFEFEDEIILLDFKTDKIKREGLYDDQLKIYKLAIEESLKKPVKKSYIYWYNFSELEEVNTNF
ncbi:UvrD-helicase domain-containing protein [Anaerococcus sp. mt242]|uniref:UvrD-helicase domain-containing protein n=1 Tax=Anaerococcus sp. mt242 TaxID=2661917 RepID=UPI0019345898|nr:UvrD-helicase domain-containing protein [Anaerococcus sp. mt242]MBM0046551.1 UvrD-helicase domain-containing protein [Anaerococcus sp. mt242]